MLHRPCLSGAFFSRLLVLDRHFAEDGLRVKNVVEQVAGGQPRKETTYYVYSSAGELLHEFDLESGEQRDHIRLAGKTIAVVGRHQGHDSDYDGMPDYYER